MELPVVFAIRRFDIYRPWRLRVRFVTWSGHNRGPFTRFIAWHDHTCELTYINASCQIYNSDKTTVRWYAVGQADSPDTTIRRDVDRADSPDTTRRDVSRADSPDAATRRDVSRANSPDATTRRDVSRANSPDATTRRDVSRADSPDVTTQWQRDVSQADSPDITTQWQRGFSRADSPDVTTHWQRGVSQADSPDVITRRDVICAAWHSTHSSLSGIYTNAHIGRFTQSSDTFDTLAAHAELTTTTAASVRYNCSIIKRPVFYVEQPRVVYKTWQLRRSSWIPRRRGTCHVTFPEQP